MSWRHTLRSRLVELLSLELRRARRKRELEAVLRSVGVSRALAARASSTYFNPGRNPSDHAK